MDIHEFDEIRPYEEGEMKEALNQLLNDRHFNKVMQGFAPWLPKGLRNGFFKMMFIGVKTPLDFQLRFMKHVVRYVLKKHAHGYTFNHSTISNRGNQLFISNHRDIVLDSAILDLMLHEAGFPTTCEIAIGDNLLIYPWIKTLVRMNKAFTVRRSLKAKEMMESSILMSRYMHYAITQKKENIWIAQREGRAKDSSDQTQESVLKMLAYGGEGTIIERLKELNIVPLTLSYEYDPCDYLKAQEFQQKRDDPSWKKNKQDDLDNMKIGIFGYKGHVHFRTGTPVNQWIDELKDMPKNEVFKEIAQRIDKAIHSNYMLYPGNFIAYDELNKTNTFHKRYSQHDKKVFEEYLRGQIAKINLPNPDEAFLRERILTMYANPVVNKIRTKDL
ncbi:MAG: 1-acyl-sn-glycerol-3-phosphate acyltransferase [Bacteroidaceae bacterium]|nr:1-acyl-sn-glycerol-3-phosphate acyltransferase [Bacteroidaceae bacterium]